MVENEGDPESENEAAESEGSEKPRTVGVKEGCMQAIGFFFVMLLLFIFLGWLNKNGHDRGHDRYGSTPLLSPTFHFTTIRVKRDDQILSPIRLRAPSPQSNPFHLKHQDDSV